MDTAREQLIERLADLEHERWSKWMTYLFTKGYSRDDGAFVIDPESVDWWQHLIDTPYAELTERSKESDRVEVRKTLAVIEDVLGAGAADSAAGGGAP
jgi:hypothetical protein